MNKAIEKLQNKKTDCYINTESIAERKLVLLLFMEIN